MSTEMYIDVYSTFPLVGYYLLDFLNRMVAIFAFGTIAGQRNIFLAKAK